VFNSDIIEVMNKADPNKTGYIDYHALCQILKSVAEESDILFDLMLAEINVSNGFSLKYADLIPPIGRAMEVWYRL
jgi:Ca2+-binding EF-hand superfamily protein